MGLDNQDFEMLKDALKNLDISLEDIEKGLAKIDTTIHKKLTTLNENICCLISAIQEK